MDAAPPNVSEEPPARDWSLLPLDVLCSVFVMVGAVDVLMGAGLVCRSWFQAAKLPDVWRVVDMANDEFMVYDDTEEVLRRKRSVVGLSVILAMAKEAVDRSGGQLRVFAGKEFVTNELIQYILERSPSLTTLRLVSYFFPLFDAQVTRVIRDSPLMELCSLELDSVSLTMRQLTDVLENCPVLEVLTVRNCFVFDIYEEFTLRSEFARIKTITLEFDDDIYGPNFESSDYVFDSEDDFETADSFRL